MARGRAYVIDGRYAIGQDDGGTIYIVDVQTWKVGKLAADGVGTRSGAAFWMRPGGTGMFMTAAVS